MIERLGPARYFTTLDHTKGYWQVPLTRTAREKTAFATPGGLYQYTVLPFGFHRALATFQRMMDQLLRPHQAYAAPYINDIIIHSASWDIHLRQLRAVLGELRKAGLTANPAPPRRPPTWGIWSAVEMSDPTRARCPPSRTVPAPPLRNR